MQLLGPGTPAHPARSPVHHGLHAEATGRPGGDQRLEVRGHGGGQVLSDSVHVFHVGRHRRRPVLGTAHNRRVTGGGEGTGTLCSLHFDSRSRTAIEIVD